MATVATEQQRKHLQAELTKADETVRGVLGAEAGRFRCASDMRESLNQARSTRQQAVTRLAALDRQQAEGR